MKLSPFQKDLLNGRIRTAYQPRKGLGIGPDTFRALKGAGIVEQGVFEAGIREIKLTPRGAQLQRAIWDRFEGLCAAEITIDGITFTWDD